MQKIKKIEKIKDFLFSDLQEVNYLYKKFIRI